MTERERFLEWYQTDLTNWYTKYSSEVARQDYNKMSDCPISEEDWHRLDEIKCKVYEGMRDKLVISLKTHASIHPNYNSNNIIVVYCPNSPVYKYQWCEFRCIRVYKTLEELKERITIGGLYET